jgi:hypothetical protein
MQKIDQTKLRKKVARQADIDAGINTVSYRRVHKNKKAYNRKQKHREIYA